MLSIQVPLMLCSFNSHNIPCLNVDGASLGPRLVFHIIVEGHERKFHEDSYKNPF